MMSNRHGLILVTGPTGSGKTTTLYTILNHLKKDNTKSIITLEDPIENILTGIRQSQINPSAGYTFIQGLRAILRQDPDIIMIGEIRDAETAKIALEAAYTGHLVLSTLHTANCESTLLRLQSFDLDPFLLGHSLKGIISQFLTPKRCEQCQQQGCKNCHDTGFKGRIALHEMLVATTPTSLKTQDDFKDFMSKNTYYPFYQDINQKIEDGKVGRDKCIG
jgi:type II secretory ATPase GspE/PulE/Tfp pilus assembly ATPase PilB-like protein